MTKDEARAAYFAPTPPTYSLLEMVQADRVVEIAARREAKKLRGSKQKGRRK